MKRTVLFAAATLLALSLSLGARAAQVAAPAKPIQVTNFGGKQAVTFDHAKHAKVDCTTCHHASAKENHKCGECHLAKEGKAPAIKDAMHGKDKGVCYGCHFQAEAKHKLKCSDCHKG